MIVFQISLVLNVVYYVASGYVERIGRSECCDYSEPVAEFVVACSEEAGDAEVEDTVNGLPDVAKVTQREDSVGLNPAFRYILTLTDPSFGYCESLNAVLDTVRHFPYVTTIEEFSCSGCPYPAWPCPEAQLLDMSVSTTQIPTTPTTNSPVTTTTSSCSNETLTTNP
uniref:NTR domain-containing protein n=1 Tax=Panagrellus redivivus TaxID=6233 RepID=A0A7E4VPX2_PANRE